MTLKAITEAMHYLSEAEEASGPAVAEECYQAAMGPLAKVVRKLMRNLDASITEHAELIELVELMEALAPQTE